MTALIATAVTPSARANQGPVLGGPIGATDLNNAMLPTNAGVYLGWTELQGWSDRIGDNRGNLTAGGSAATISALYAQYVYPIHIVPGTLASGIQDGYEVPGHVYVRGKPQQTLVGWRDLYVDFLNWSYHVGPVFGESFPDQAGHTKIPYGLTVKVEYSMIFPTGHYDVTSIANPGNNTIFYIPNAAITYLTRPTRLGGPLEFDLHAFYDIRARNPANAYDNGAIMDLDYAIAQRFRGYTLGFTGSYAVQVQDDTRRTTTGRTRASPEGDHVEVLTFGPIASFPVPALHGFFKIKAPFSLEGRNTLRLNTIVANLVFPLP